MVYKVALKDVNRNFLSTMHENRNYTNRELELSGLHSRFREKCILRVKFPNYLPKNMFLIVSKTAFQDFNYNLFSYSTRIKIIWFTWVNIVDYVKKCIQGVKMS